MLDISKTIVPKSDQLNADDLIIEPMTVTVTKVTSNNSKDQPVSVHYEGGEGKPYKPCLSMRRVMIKAWGKNAEDYKGRSMTLYNDPTVKWAGSEVGGIRISHMSHIDKSLKVILSVSKTKRVPYTVEPLEIIESTLSESELDKYLADIANATCKDELSAAGKTIAEIKDLDSESRSKLSKAYKTKATELEAE